MIKLPDGEMCCGCVHRSRDCSYIIFDKAPLIGKYDKDTQKVKCPEYHKDWEKIANERLIRIKQLEEYLR